MRERGEEGREKRSGVGKDERRGKEGGREHVCMFVCACERERERQRVGHLNGVIGCVI